MSDSRSTDRSKEDAGRAGLAPWRAADRPRPPGPEEKRGATATSRGGDGSDQRPSFWRTLRLPRFWLILIALLVLNQFLVPIFFPQPNDRVTVSYTFFKQQVNAGNVTDITGSGQAIQGDFKQAVPDPAPVAGQTPKTYTKFATQTPTFADDPSLMPLLEQKGVQITARPLDAPRSVLLTLVLSFAPTLLLLGGFLWLSNRAARAAGGGMFGMGRSRARRYDAGENTVRVNFDDVAGIDEVENELVEIVDFLKQPDKYQRLGGRIPKGVLLIGSPGTGKTLLARAVAGEAGVPFFSMSGSEF